MECVLNQETVKARKVGDSIVMTLPRSILKATGFSAGDSLMVRTEGTGFLSVRKENNKMSQIKEKKMELKILRMRLKALNVEQDLALHEYRHGAPTRHPGIEQPELMEGTMKEWHLQECEIKVEIAKKELEIYRMSGPETERHTAEDTE